MVDFRMIKNLVSVLLIGLSLLSCKRTKENNIALGQYDLANNDAAVKALIEIPAGTLEKWEFSKSTGKIELELINNKPRIINYLGYPANYGMIPNTILAKENGGDGDPLDVIVIGPQEPMGSLVECKIIGVLYLIDNQEKDDKLIAISNNSNLNHINEIDELNHHYNGILKILETWFTNYKGGEQIRSEGFGDSKSAEKILLNARNQFLDNL